MSWVLDGFGLGFGPEVMCMAEVLLVSWIRDGVLAEWNESSPGLHLDCPKKASQSFAK